MECAHDLWRVCPAAGRETKGSRGVVGLSPRLWLETFVMI